VCHLILSLQLITWLVFTLWMLGGAAIYMFYGRRHSNAPAERPVKIPDEAATKNFRTRDMRPAAGVGIVLLIVIAILLGVHGLDGDYEFSAVGLVLWWLAVLACLVGAVAIVNAIRVHNAANKMIDEGDLQGAATGIRKVILTVSIALVIPGLLTVLAMRGNQTDPGSAAAPLSIQPTQVAAQMGSSSDS
jgi:hypothetical protein